MYQTFVVSRRWSNCYVY